MTASDMSRPPGRRRPIRVRPRRPYQALVAAGVAVLIAGVLSLAALRPGDAAADTVGAGGYTTTQVGPLPSGCGSISTDPRQWVTANAPSGAVPTNDWWSSILWKRTNCAYGEPLAANPLSFRAQAGGLGFSYTTTPSISGSATGPGEYHFPYREDFVAGVAQLNSSEVKVDGWSDWTVSPYLSDGARSLRATIGKGLPFAFFRTSGGNARIAASGGATPAVWSNSGSWIGYTINGHDYAAYAPVRSDLDGQRLDDRLDARREGLLLRRRPADHRVEQRCRPEEPGDGLRKVRLRPRHRHSGLLPV
ncbi:hypothetical protein ACFQY7_04165 [Actinomadura luteofluorescens]|uniref:hypothetical protein n=1 Tax=Actinomadura luteofluorescens TaxID=46163 RepID=UPI00363C1CDE